MASTGPNYPSNAVSLANSGTSENANAWVNPAGVQASGGTVASITAATFDSPDISELIVAYNFGFSVTGTVTGITVEISKRGYTSTDSGKDFRVQLATGTTFADLVGDNKASGSVWPQTTRATSTYGSSSDTWNAGLTAAQVNSSTFAVFLSAYANVANADIDVDFIRVTIETGASTSATQQDPATATGAAYADTAKVEARGTGAATSTGEALVASAKVSREAQAGVAEGTASASGDTAKVQPNATEAAAATGTTQAGAVSVSAWTGHAAATGLGLDATAQTTAGAITFNAQVAEGTALAIAARGSLAASLGFAAGRSS